MKKPPSRRSIRLADEIMQTVGRLLVEEVRDPRLELVTVSGVRLNADISVARVYLTFSGDEQRRKEVMAALDKARGFFRSRVGAVLKLKKTPELRFVFDEYLEDMVYDQ
jgi:ribosome-binding factor A